MLGVPLLKSTQQADPYPNILATVPVLLLLFYFRASILVVYRREFSVRCLPFCVCALTLHHLLLVAGHLVCLHFVVFRVFAVGLLLLSGSATTIKRKYCRY